jgi:hypothetical protein
MGNAGGVVKIKSKKIKRPKRRMSKSAIGA